MTKKTPNDERDSAVPQSLSRHEVLLASTATLAGADALKEAHGAGSATPAMPEPFRNDPEGSFDEFYYILSGSGEMEIDGRRVPVKAGDHIFTPNGVAHGIENTSIGENLKVYLVAMRRG